MTAAPHKSDPIATIGLSTKPARALWLLGIQTVGEFIELDLTKVLKLSGHGAGTYRDLARAQARLVSLLLQGTVPPGSAKVVPNAEQEAVPFAKAVETLGVRALHTIQALKVETLPAFLNLTREGVLAVRAAGRTTWREIERLQQTLAEGAPPDLQSILPQCPQDPVAFSTLRQSLGPRGQRVLDRLGITDLESFLRVARDDVLLQQNAGMITWLQLKKAQLEASAHALPLLSDTFFTEYALRLTPLFNGTSFSGGSQSLHQTFYQDDPITVLTLPHRAAKAVSKRSIRTIGQLLCTPPSQFLKLKNCGEDSLKCICDAVRTYLLDRNGLIKVEPLNTDSFDALTHDLIGRLLPSDTKRTVLLARLGLPSGQIKTLGQVAADIHCTRERVRQIEVKAKQCVHDPLVPKLLSRFWTLTHELLVGFGGILYFSELTQLLTDRMAWETPPNSRALDLLFKGFPGHGFRLSQEILATVHKCHSCQVAQRFLSSLLGTRKRLDLPEAQRILKTYCDGHCANACIPRHGFSRAFIVDLCSSPDHSSTRLQCTKDGVLYTDSEWDIKYSSIPKKCEAILLQAGGPVSHLVVKDTLAKECSVIITPNRADIYLAGLDSAVMWGRGLFVHIDNIVYDSKCIDMIQAELKKRLSRKMPFVSAFGLFNEFRTRCVASGIPNDHALYSLLRRHQTDAYICDRYPYIRSGLKGYRSEKAHRFVEAMLQEADGPVSIASIHKRLCHDMGLRDTHCNQAIALAEGVIRIDKDQLMHVDSIKASRKDLAPVFAHAQHLLERSGHVSVARLFADKRVTCLAAGILGPYMLYSLLTLYFGDKLSLTRYPQIRRQGEGSKNHIHDEILSYVFKEQRPVALDELRRVFVEERGYSVQTVEGIAYHDHMLRYYPRCVVHSDVLGWSVSKAEKLFSVAAEQYRRCEKAGGYIASISSLIEQRENDLPPLAASLGWTEVLASDLLSRQPNVRLLGNTRNAYVILPNEKGIDSLGDLIAVIVKEKFGGGCSQDDLSDFLCRSGIIRKNLTASMLGDGDKVILSDQQIVLKGLR